MWERSSLYVFAQRLSAPFPMSPATASVWIAREAKRLEKLTWAATRKASQAISSAGLEAVAEYAGSPFDS